MFRSRPIRRPGAALVAVLLGFFVVMLDTTIINVALPMIGADLDVPVTSLQWVVNAYALSLAAFQLGAGSACDRLGARTVYVTGLLVFALFSVICALAPNDVVLVAARGAQGLGAAAVVPGSLALLARLHDDDGARSRVIGLWGGAGGFAAAIGPSLGGGLVSLLGWRVAFWMNLPVVAVAVWLVVTAVPGVLPWERDRSTGRVDVVGPILSAAGLGCLAHGAVTLGLRDWSPGSLMVPGIGCLAVFLFVAAERRASAPMLPPDVLASADFGVPVLAGLCLNAGFFGQLFVLSLFLQQHLGLSAWAAGLVLTPQACSAIVASPLGGRAAARFGATPTMLAGLLLGASGFVALAVVGPTAPYPVVGLVGVVGGFGTALAVPAATLAAMAAMPPARRGLAGAVSNSARQVGSLVGVAVLGAVMVRTAFVPGFRMALVGAACVFQAAVLTVAIMGRGVLYDRHHRWEQGPRFPSG